MNKFSQLIITIAIIVVGAWLLMLSFRIAAWLINGLVALAALVLVIALVYHFVSKKSTPNKKAPLKIEREPSKEKK